MDWGQVVGFDACGLGVTLVNLRLEMQEEMRQKVEEVDIDKHVVKPKPHVFEEVLETLVFSAPTRRDFFVVLTLKGSLNISEVCGIRRSADFLFISLRRCWWYWSR